MVNELTYQLQKITLGFIIGLFIKILISSFTLFLSVKLVGGRSSLKKSIALTTIMEMINLIVLPLFSSGILSLFLYVVLWLVLVIIFFEVSLWKAILVAVIQGIVTLIFTILSVLALIETLVGVVFILK
jgi:hypothetical protein